MTLIQVQMWLKNDTHTTSRPEQLSVRRVLTYSSTPPCTSSPVTKASVSAFNLRVLIGASVTMISILDLYLVYRYWVRV